MRNELAGEAGDRRDVLHPRTVERTHAVLARVQRNSLSMEGNPLSTRPGEVDADDPGPQELLPAGEGLFFNLSTL